ncbi:MAG: type 1 fimbriae regulatory protein fimB [Gammaproteobacteria bacterium]|nr:type 1 fimbriae regulatory protein fimB [Gammaproteobacteria bacterium]
MARAGKNAQFPFTVHPHMLRYSTGFYLANHGHDTRAIQSYLGHANINNTVIYTQLSPTRFKDFWKDQGSILVKLC